MLSARKSFSTRLSMTIVTFTSVLFISAIAMAAFSSYRLIVEEATKNASNVLAGTIKDIEGTLTAVERTVQATDWLVREHSNEPDYLYMITERVVSENKNIIGSAIAFAPDYFSEKYYFSPFSYRDKESGEIGQKQLGTDDYDYFNMEWFQRPFDTGKDGWTEPYVDEGGSDHLMTTFSHPVRDAQGRIFAVMTADIGLDWLAGQVSAIKPYPQSYTALFSRSGEYISAGERSPLREQSIYDISQSAENPAIRLLCDSILSGKGGTTHFKTENGRNFVVYGPLKNGWVAAIMCQYRAILTRASRMMLIITLIGLFGLAVLFQICYYTIRKLTSPLSEFARSALSIAKGNFNTPLPEIRTEDELRRMHDSFDYMQKSLNSYIHELQQTTAENERFESELTIARDIQMHMVPTDFPQRDDMDLYAFIKPAREVGGDLYDFFVKDDTVYFAIGDVSGKGVPASLVMAITRSSFRFIAGMDLTLDQVMYKVNNAITEGNETGMFVTLFIGAIDLRTGTMRYCNAGHNPAVAVAPDGTASFLPAIPNLAVGVFTDFAYKMQETTLRKGSRLLLYTDGVTEAENSVKAQYGEDRLKDWCCHIPEGESAKAMAEDLLSDVQRFTDGADQNDDITILTLSI